MRIAGSAPLQGVLGGALTIPCYVHDLRPPAGRRGALGSPRVKWTFLSGGREAEVLVARGLRVKVSDAYRFRVALPAYPASLTDVSLALSELRPNDSGIYRCEVQHGIDDSSDAVEVKVKGQRAGALGLGGRSWDAQRWSEGHRVAVTSFPQGQGRLPQSSWLCGRGFTLCGQRRDREGRTGPRAAARAQAASLLRRGRLSLPRGLCPLRLLLPPGPGGLCPHRSPHRHPRAALRSLPGGLRAV